MNQSTYPIGTPGEPWDENDKALWLAQQHIRRSYKADVLDRVEALSGRDNAPWELLWYGNLPYDQGRYPLVVFKSKPWREDATSVLVSGGVHGYETSGVQGALRFIDEYWQDYAQDINFIVAPCISPWGYETINRWNPAALDPNRSFFEHSGALEAQTFMAFLAGQNIDFTAHVDLHETTDTDNSEFRKALAARDNKPMTYWHIPDGFYTVGDLLKDEPAFQKAIIDAVAQVTHIAPADDDNRLIGVRLEQTGVINYPARELGLCAGLTNAPYVTTTEVYPDSPLVTDENCVLAQVAAIRGALTFVLQR